MSKNVKQKQLINRLLALGCSQDDVARLLKASVVSGLVLKRTTEQAIDTLNRATLALSLKPLQPLQPLQPLSYPAEKRPSKEA